MTKPNNRMDIAWFHAAIAERKYPKTEDGDGSAFSERVAIILEGDESPELVRSAREWALGDWRRARGIKL